MLPTIASQGKRAPTTSRCLRPERSVHDRRHARIEAGVNERLATPIREAPAVRREPGPTSPGKPLRSIEGNCQSTSGHPCPLTSPAAPATGDVDDVVPGRGRILLVPGDAEADPEIDAAPG